jgi:hypothetical protein
VFAQGEASDVFVRGTTTGYTPPASPTMLLSIDATGWAFDLAGGNPYQPCVLFFGTPAARGPSISKLSFNEFGKVTVDLDNAVIYPTIFQGSSSGRFAFFAPRPGEIPAALLGVDVGIQAAWLEWKVTSDNSPIPSYTVTPLLSDVATFTIR